MTRFSVALCLVATLLTLGIVFRHEWLNPAYDPTVPLDLRAPLNFMTPVKLRLTAQMPALCRAALQTAAFPFSEHTKGGSAECPLVNFVTVRSGLPALSPSSFPASCALAIRWSLFETAIVTPAARSTFGSGVATIHHLGSFACRDVRNHPGFQSSHATADAIDVAGFTLSDGQDIPVSDWQTNDRRAAFLHRVRDGACSLFGTVLSPDYDALHASHLHLQATGFGLCR